MGKKDKEMNTMKKVTDGAMDLSDDQLESAAGGEVTWYQKGFKNNKYWQVCYFACDMYGVKRLVRDRVFNSKEEALAYADKMGLSTSEISLPETLTQLK